MKVNFHLRGEEIQVVLKIKYLDIFTNVMEDGIHI